ncbi:MAG: uridine diphosphate-N-acetylglucosamine-binding protein YvcK [Anaerolineales bacterium]
MRWIEPGLQIKRWLLLLGFGVAIVSLSLAALLRAFYPLPAYFYILSLQFLPRAIRAVVLFLVGGGCIAAGLWGLNRSLMAPFLANTDRPYPEMLYEYRQLERGPRIVVIGGGHGQATLLRGLKRYTSHLTAIVTVADDGGSSGRLRRELGILPPGDFRNCIAALADDESLVTRVLQYRFRSSAGLDQHSFGNLFISAMSGVTGSFEAALAESSRVLAVRGEVVPSSLEPVVLGADVQVGDETPQRVYGESQIPRAGGRVLRVLLEPSGPRAYPGAIQAILKADLIAVGPGSLYTSILPNLLVPEIVEAIRASRALKVYICNVATQRGETDGYAAEEHLQALETHVGPGIFTTVVVNEPVDRVELPAGVSWVPPALEPRAGLEILKGDLVGEEVPWQHHDQKLAATIMSLLKG